MRTSRREFVKFVTASGIALSLSRLSFAEEPAFAARTTLPGRLKYNPVAGIGRIDGVAKVTGAKLFASDFRAADFPGWPAKTAHAILVRAPDATRVYAGMDLGRLSGASKPSVVVTADDVVKINARMPEFFGGDLFCPVGKTPIYMGQPVALLIFEQFDAFDQARLALRDGTFVKFGAQTAPVDTPYYAAYRFTRVAGPTPEAPDVYSAVQEGWVSPDNVQNAPRPVWSAGTPAAYAKAAKYGEQIRKDLAATTPSLLVLERDFETQSTDAVFLDPEAGLAWYDTSRKNLEIIIGVQAPYQAADFIAYLLGQAKDPFKPKSIDANFAYLGGAFGGRDNLPFPLYLALAAMFLPNRPVRLAHDRYQQFQGGTKRHAFKMHSKIGFDRTTGRIAAFAADHVIDGGGLAGISASMATTSALGAIGIYDIPKVDITTAALHSRGVTAGSMRGYGTIQTMTALEVLIDDLAIALSPDPNNPIIDPIELRRGSALKPGGRTLAGNKYSVSVRTTEILDKLGSHPIWRHRAEEKSRARPGFVVGTGVACATKDYGSGADCSQGWVEVDPTGRISIHLDHVEVGNGIGTAAAYRVASHLGRIADEVSVARIDTFDALGMIATGDPYSMSQQDQDKAQRDPRWVPQIGSATGASTGAHIGTHASAEAARVIFRFGLWPAALELWGITPTDPRAKDWAKARWQDGQLAMAGLAPLAMSTIAAKAHTRNFVTGAVAHGFSRWSWAQATFTIAGQPWTGEIDALALRRGVRPYQRIDRTSVKFPPTAFNSIGTTYTTQCGTLVRVDIERATGALRIAQAYSVLECGEALVPEIVAGMAQGGFAMGVGYALLETLPPYEGGPGNGQWNLGQYLIPRGSDLPLHGLEVEVLPALPNEAPKGMGEVVMIPVVPALINAIFDATGRRFQSLPVTQSMLKGALA